MFERLFKKIYCFFFYDNEYCEEWKAIKGGKLCRRKNGRTKKRKLKLLN
jgi:hypothetical protein